MGAFSARTNGVAVAVQQMARSYSKNNVYVGFEFDNEGQPATIDAWLDVKIQIKDPNGKLLVPHERSWPYDRDGQIIIPKAQSLQPLPLNDQYSFTVLGTYFADVTFTLHPGALTVKAVEGSTPFTVSTGWFPVVVSG